MIKSKQAYLCITLKNDKMECSKKINKDFFKVTKK
jgi:hypothetical protein